MLLDGLFNTKNNLILKKVLDYSTANQRVIAHNIANAETPGYIAKKVSFFDDLTSAIKSGDLNEISKVKYEVGNDFSRPFKMDMNNVDMEHQLLEMNKNKMRFDYVSSLLSKRLKGWVKIFEGVKN